VAATPLEDSTNSSTEQRLEGEGSVLETRFAEPPASDAQPERPLWQRTGKRGRGGRAAKRRSLTSVRPYSRRLDGRSARPLDPSQARMVRPPDLSVARPRRGRVVKETRDGVAHRHLRTSPPVGCFGGALNDRSSGVVSGSKESAPRRDSFSHHRSPNKYGERPLGGARADASLRIDSEAAGTSC
jgi:hypothetical protein